MSGDDGLTVCTTRAELAKARADLPGRVGVVMTMGALHPGHATLVEAAAADADHVIATIFVNPLQFGPTEDFNRYPRTVEADLALLREHGVAAAFVPPVGEVYPNGEPSVRVAPGAVASILEGAHRPGHFDGVLTVVLKLLNLTRADLAFFGEKDYQQLTLIRSMVDDLSVPVTIVGVETVREPDGLALSSRNRYLSTTDRTAALALNRALRAGAAQGGAGADAVLAAARAELAAEPVLDVDYLALTDVRLGPPPAHGPARLLVAAKVGDGGTRLIDNVGLTLRS
jgi:pantoate--beta-alanine ligase